MTWLILAFISAALLGCYDTLKKVALKDNAVIPVLFFNTFFSSLIFLPLILLSGATTMLDDSIFHVGSGGWEMHKYIVLKAILVLSSWILGYFAMKNLPLTIVGPINATSTSDGAGGCPASFRGTFEWLAMGRCLDGDPFIFLVKKERKEGGY